MLGLAARRCPGLSGSPGGPRPAPPASLPAGATVTLSPTACCWLTSPAPARPLRTSGRLVLSFPQTGDGGCFWHVCFCNFVKTPLVPSASCALRYLLCIRNIVSGSCLFSLLFQACEFFKGRDCVLCSTLVYLVRCLAETSSNEHFGFTIW